MIKKYEFSIGTMYVNSIVREVVEFEFDDDATEDEIHGVVSDAYSEWLADNNNGGFVEI